MKTREQRLIDGWTENWGLFDYNDETWLGVGGTWETLPKKRLTYASFGRAQDAGGHRSGVCPRRFWTRHKPRTYKVGDNVLVRARVTSIDGADQRLDLCVRVEDNGHSLWVGSRSGSIAKRRA